jgi:hypothetical protein
MLIYLLLRVSLMESHGSDMIPTTIYSVQHQKHGLTISLIPPSMPLQPPQILLITHIPHKRNQIIQRNNASRRHPKLPPNLTYSTHPRTPRKVVLARGMPL